ncbi:MAG: hypothetical protein AB8F95_18580 [Bacteroidia bacterium]
MRFILVMLLLSSFVAGCQSEDKATKHIFYLHGRIIEVQGVDAVSEKFGEYHYNDIIDSLKSTGAVIHNEVRTTQTDFQTFCIRTSGEIDRLIAKGVKPEDVTVIGASKGAVMAMNISNMNIHPVNYVLLAANNAYIEREQQWNLHGRILGIYERSDSLAGRPYDHWITVSSNAVEFEQIEINTGLGHGFLYQPLEAWLRPVKKWMYAGGL